MSLPIDIDRFCLTLIREAPFSRADPPKLAENPGSGTGFEPSVQLL